MPSAAPLPDARVLVEIESSNEVLTIAEAEKFANVLYKAIVAARKAAERDSKDAA